jgi:tRNA (mo5U34)-methyltransferase
MPIPWAGRRRARPHRLTFGRRARPHTESRRAQINDFVVRSEEVRAYAERLNDEPSGLSLSERVAGRFWYHTIDLPGGLTTAGMFDHRKLVPHYGIPADLTGKRVLDIGVWDGFWSFEFERRGAEVVALDVEKMSDTDLPAGQREALERSGYDYRFGDGFELAREALGSRVTKVIGNIYDLDPDVLGTFDLVHVGDVLLHLESPTVALRQVRRVTRGEAMLVLAYHRKLKKKVVEYLGGWGNATWWIPSLDATAQMVRDAGFVDIKLHKTYRLDEAGGTTGHWRAIYFAKPPEAGMDAGDEQKSRRLITRSRLHSVARAGAVAAVAIAAIFGTRSLMDRGTPQPRASSQSTSGNLDEASRVLNTGVETAPTDESAPQVDLASGSEDVDERALAITVDRTLVDSGRPQVYGTQHRCEEGDLVPATPIEEPDEVDALRAEAGLPPLEQSVAEASAEKDPCPDAGN